LVHARLVGVAVASARFLRQPAVYGNHEELRFCWLTRS